MMFDLETHNFGNYYGGEISEKIETIY